MVCGLLMMLRGIKSFGASHAISRHELPLAIAMYERNARERSRCDPVGLDAQSRPTPFVDRSRVLLNDRVQAMAIGHEYPRPAPVLATKPAQSPAPEDSLPTQGRPRS